MNICFNDVECTVQCINIEYISGNIYIMRNEPRHYHQWRWEYEENSFVELQAFWKKSISGHNEPTSMARQGWKCQEYSGPKIVLSLR